MFSDYFHLFLAVFSVNSPEYSVKIGEEYELDTGSSASAALHTLILQRSIINTYHMINFLYTPSEYTITQGVTWSWGQYNVQGKTWEAQPASWDYERLL